MFCLFENKSLLDTIEKWIRYKNASKMIVHSLFLSSEYRFDRILRAKMIDFPHLKHKFGRFDWQIDWSLEEVRQPNLIDINDKFRLTMIFQQIFQLFICFTIVITICQDLVQILIESISWEVKGTHLKIKVFKRFVQNRRKRENPIRNIRQMRAN